MKITLFLTQLKKAMEKIFPTLIVDFFVSRRNRYIHMGLNRPLHSIENFMEVLQFIENLRNEKKKKMVTKVLFSADILKWYIQ